MPKDAHSWMQHRRRTIYEETRGVRNQQKDVEGMGREGQLYDRRERSVDDMAHWPCG